MNDLATSTSPILRFSRTFHRVLVVDLSSGCSLFMLTCTITMLHRCCKGWLLTSSVPVQGSLWANGRVLRLPGRVGFGHAVKAALLNTTTEYVMIVQHDHALNRGFDMPEVLAFMTVSAWYLRKRRRITRKNNNNTKL